MISDLHLGDGRASRCARREETRARLVRFIQYVTEQAARPVHLLVNSDIVDFLAEAPWEAFYQRRRAASKTVSDL